MRRREFVTLLGGATMVWPLAARAQQPAIPVVGFLSSRSPSESAEVIMSFRRGLQEKGFVEGQNVVIAFRWAEGAYNRLPSLADELVGLCELPYCSLRVDSPQHFPPRRPLRQFL